MAARSQAMQRHGNRQGGYPTSRRILQTHHPAAWIPSKCGIRVLSKYSFSLHPISQREAQNYSALNAKTSPFGNESTHRSVGLFKNVLIYTYILRRKKAFPKTYGCTWIEFRFCVWVSYDIHRAARDVRFRTQSYGRS
jgi:hypothetical protein